MGNRRRTENVNEVKVDGGSRGGAPAPVEQPLGIEGNAPGEEIDPAEEGGEEREEAVGGHGGE